MGNPAKRSRRGLALTCCAMPPVRLLSCTANGQTLGMIGALVTVLSPEVPCGKFGNVLHVIPGHLRPLQPGHNSRPLSRPPRFCHANPENARAKGVQETKTKARRKMMRRRERMRGPARRLLEPALKRREYYPCQKRRLRAPPVLRVPDSPMLIRGFAPFL